MQEQHSNNAMNGTRINTIPNVSAMLSFGWGVFVLIPFSSVFDKNPHLFAPMVALVPLEAFWGSLFAVCGLVGILFSLSRREQWTAWLMFVVFILFATLYAIGDYSQPGWFFMGTIAVANYARGMWNRVRQ
jgi:uncharacterized membrane protein HdeD (DUF308 family)